MLGPADIPGLLRHHSVTPDLIASNRQRRGSAGGRPTGFDKQICRRRKETERTMNVLKGFRALATRYDKRSCIFHGTVTVAAIRLRLRP